MEKNFGGYPRNEDTGLDVSYYQPENFIALIESFKKKER